MAHTLGLIERSEDVAARDLIEVFRWKQIVREPWMVARRLPFLRWLVPASMSSD